ncbi:MAG: hypothetical protein ABI729_04230 [Chitinophagales bacterium]
MIETTVSTYADGNGTWHADVTQKFQAPYREDGALARRVAWAAVEHEIVTRHQDDVLTELRLDGSGVVLTTHAATFSFTESPREG